MSTSFLATLVALGALLIPASTARGALALRPDTLLNTALDVPLPLDPHVRTGRLANGLTYYVRRNTEPANRAELRLAVDAGSILEGESERGLAHFLEHMLFNGTERFPKNALVDFLERTGMRFGPDVNAYTSFDETVYMLQIPTDRAEIVDRAFDVLEDWAANATLAADEVEKEIGVVVAEWRDRGQNYQGRLRERILPVLFHASRYRERLPIGHPDVIAAFDSATVRAFYERWYRPDLMAVVAVGDFDPDRIEQLIRERFGSIPARPDDAVRPTFDVPGHDETLIEVATDRELPYSSVTVYFKQDVEPEETVEDYRERLVGSLFNDLLNQRLEEVARRPGAPFVGASVFRGSLARPSLFYGIGAHVQDDSVVVGLEAILNEAARVVQHGFTEAELERLQRETLRTYERAYAERENTRSASYADEYVAHFLEGEPAPGIAFELALVREHLPTITLEEVNERAEDLLAGDSRAVIVQMPEKEGLAAPTEAELAAVLERVEERELEPYEDEAADRPLMAEPPTPAAVAAERRIDELGIVELALSNGVRVVLKPTDFKDDEVRFTAFSPGGTSLVSDDAIFEAEMAATLVSQSGVASFSRTQLDKLLAGQVVQISPYVGELDEGMSGMASPQDLETLFQLIHLFFTEPRADSTALATVQNQLRAYLANRAANPMMVFQDSLQAALYGHHPRRRPTTLAQVDTLDLHEAFAVYRDRFADAGDFTFVFAGNFDVDRLRTLAQTYLATLPSTARGETWRDVYPALPPGRITTSVYKGIGQQSQALLLFHGPLHYNRATRHVVRSLADVLEIELREELREARSAVYNVGVSAGTTAEPDSSYRLSINFAAAPDRVDELVEAVFTEIERIKTDGPSPETVEKVKEQQLRERETALETNHFWVSVLEFYYSQDTEPLHDVLNYDALIESLSAEQIRDAARQYLDADRYVRAVLYPAEPSGD